MVGEVVSQSQLQEQMNYSRALADSTIIPDSYRGNPANILIAMDFGRSMGLSPAESLYRINVIKGKPTMSAELIASSVRKAGHKLWVEKDPEKISVTAFIQRKDDPDHIFSETRDATWAHSMGLDRPDRNGNPSNYQKQPMTMLKWRAITAVAREACSEALYGVAYSPDEMMDDPTVHVEDVQEEKLKSQWPEPETVEAEIVDETDGEKNRKALLAGLHDVKEQWLSMFSSASKTDFNNELRRIVGRQDVAPQNITLTECETAMQAFKAQIIKQRNKTNNGQQADEKKEAPSEQKD